MKFPITAVLFGALFAIPLACGDDADELGVGAECSTNDDCAEEQACLSFKGGYCGISGCSGDADCPDNSACVSHDDGKNYCFRTCANKTECNENRSADNEANCSSSITFVDNKKSTKACVPPS